MRIRTNRTPHRNQNDRFMQIVADSQENNLPEVHVVEIGELLVVSLTRVNNKGRHLHTKSYSFNPPNPKDQNFKPPNPKPKTKKRGG